MARAFTDREREIIRKDLLEKGREFFGKYGLRKTSIEDLTRAVDIAQGSFYTFFDSKEELYLEIIEQEEDIIKDKFKNEYITDEKLTKDRFKGLLKKAIDIINTNPILKRVLLADEIQLLVRRLPSKKIDRYHQRDFSDLIPIIEKWQEMGYVIKKRPQVILEVVRSMFFPIVHKKDTRKDIYEETIDLMVDLLADGLIIDN